MAITINGSTGITSSEIADGTITTDDISSSDVKSLKSGRKNLIINGAMQVAQRGASSSTIIGGGNFSCDRVLMNIQTQFDNTSTIGQNLNSVTPPTGFTKYVGLEVDTATTLTGDTYYNFRHQIEGNNVSQLNLGSSNAKTITISFWVRSSLTGTFSFSVRNGASDRSYVTTYTISSANTWEKKTITIAGDTTGTWYADTQVGLTVNWGLGNSVGTYSTSTLNEWQSGSKTGSTTGVDLVETVNANWYITGIQLEVGSVATDFEHRSYGEELALCQRYYQIGAARLRIYPMATTDGWITMIQDVNFKVTMRTSPSVTYGNESSGHSTDSVTDEYVRVKRYYNSHTNERNINTTLKADAEL